jgi:hypothetical protein
MLNSIKNLWSGVYKNIPHCNEGRERKKASPVKCFRVIELAINYVCIFRQN